MGKIGTTIPHKQANWDNMYGARPAKFDKQAVAGFENDAKQGNAEAQATIGCIYMNGEILGEGVIQDFTKAVEWFQKAIEQGNEAAHLNLAYMYLEGHGVNQNLELAVELHKKIPKHPTAQTNLGFAYEQGKGVNQDYNEALKWYSMAVEQGNAVAQYNLGMMYKEGRGVKQDVNEAIKLFQLSSSKGYKLAGDALVSIHK